MSKRPYRRPPVGSVNAAAERGFWAGLWAGQFAATGDPIYARRALKHAIEVGGDLEKQVREVVATKGEGR